MFLLKMDQHIFLIFILLCESNGYEIEFQIQLAKSCLPQQNFKVYHIIVKQSQLSDEEIVNILKIYQQASFIILINRYSKFMYEMDCLE